MTLYAGKHLAQGLELIEAIQKEGIPVISMRGPFTGVEYFGDPALRYFTDLDLLVPRKHRRNAYEIARLKGFNLRHKGMPIGFFERNHLHYALRKDGTGTLVDLHWDVDHPFSLLHVDFNDIFKEKTRFEHQQSCWDRPRSEHLILLTCIHLAKHMRQGVFAHSNADFIEFVLKKGCLVPYLDVALMLKADAGGIDWSLLKQAARAWKAESALEAVIFGVQRLFDLNLACHLLINCTVKANQSIKMQDRNPDVPSVVGSWAEKTGGFRGERITDAVPYLFPGAVYFDLDESALPMPIRRTGHFLKASGRLLVAGIDAVVCTCIRSFRNRFGGAA